MYSIKNQNKRQLLSSGTDGAIDIVAGIIPERSLPKTAKNAESRPITEFDGIESFFYWSTHGRFGNRRFGSGLARNLAAFSFSVSLQFSIINNILRVN